jgi:hypothetical protein
MALCPAGHTSSADDFCDTCGLLIGPMSQAQPTADAWGAAAPPLGGPGAPVSPLPEAAGSGGGAPRAAGPACPNCGAGRTGRFCEGCGLDFTKAAPPAPTGRQAEGMRAQPSAEAMPRPVSRQPPTALMQNPVAPVQPVDPAAAGPQGGGRQASSWTVIVSADHRYYEHVRAAGGPDTDGIEFPAYVADRQFPLTGAAMRIGRHSPSRGLYPEIDLSGPPADPGISRLHAVLMAGPGGWSVLDPGSANGTLLNGAEIPVNEEVPLREGDRINLGAWTLITIQRG